LTVDIVCRRFQGQYRNTREQCFNSSDKLFRTLFSRAVAKLGGDNNARANRILSGCSDRCGDGACGMSDKVGDDVRIEQKNGS